MFKQATKTRQRARIALIGPSGSGKTYTALTLAKEMAGDGDIAVIDSERGSASKYAGDVADFQVVELDSFSPETYTKTIEAAASVGFPVLVIDSLSHAWAGKDGALEQVDRRGGKFQAWKDVTPMQQRLIDAILSYPGHVITTLRAKTQYVVETNRGKTEVRKVGLAPVQRDGLEYEFDVVGTMDDRHNFTVSKTRCPALSGQVIPQPGADLAKTIMAWLGDGEDPAVVAAKQLLAMYAGADNEQAWREANGQVTRQSKRVSFTDAQKADIKAACDEAKSRVRGEQEEGEAA